MKLLFKIATGLMLLAAPVMAQVTGKVTLIGKAPEMNAISMTGECAKMHVDPVLEESVVAGDNGELKNVVVSIKNDDAHPLPGEAPKTPAVLDQKGCVYSPHVLAMMVGQDLIVKNSDACLHNVHGLSKDNGFNAGQPGVNDGQKIDPQPQVPEIFRVKCDVHPWMSAWIAVFDHPYFAVTGDDGTFAIKGLADGTYTIIAWHERYGSQEQKLVVKSGKAQMNFTFDANAKRPR